MNRLRQRRLELGLGQAELGRKAGISRQAVNAIERGQTRASVDTALQLAAVLGLSVEGLFGATDRSGAWWPDNALAPRVGMRVAIERWPEHEVARPIAAYPPEASAAAHGEVRAVGRGRVDVELWSQRPALFIYGCDPVLGLLASHVSRGGGEGWWWHASNAQALALLKAGTARAVGLHHGVLEARAIDHTCLRFRLVGWQSGWLVAPDNPKGIRAAADLMRPEVKIGVREAGAEGRRLLEQQLVEVGVSWADVADRTVLAGSQLGAARLVSEGVVDVAIGHAGAAAALACELIPIREEVTDLLLPRALIQQAEVQELLSRLTSGSFRRDLAAAGPYDTERTGEQID